MSTSIRSETYHHGYTPTGPAQPRAAHRATTVRAHALLWYFGLSYAITWLVWLPLMLDPRRALPTSPWWPLHFLGASGPFAAGLIVAGLSEGRDGVRALLAGFRPRRAQATWLAVALLLPLALWASAAGVARAVFETRVPGVALLTEWPKLPGLGVLAGLLLLFVTNGIGEEGGWRGYALPRLQARHGPLAATVLLTLGWAVWHVPLFLRNPTFATMPAAGVVGWAVSLFAGAVVLTWLYNGSRGSTLAAAVFHTAMNLVWMSRAVQEPVSSTLGACTIVFALAVAPWLWRVRPVSSATTVRSRGGGP